MFENRVQRKIFGLDREEETDDRRKLYIDLFITLNLPTTTIVAQPFNVIKWQLKFNPVA